MVRARPPPLFLFPYQNCKFPDLVETSETSQPVLGRSFITEVPSSRLSKGAVRSKLSPGDWRGLAQTAPGKGMWWDMLIKTGRCGPASLYMCIYKGPPHQPKDTSSQVANY